MMDDSRAGVGLYSLVPFLSRCPSSSCSRDIHPLERERKNVK